MLLIKLERVDEVLKLVKLIPDEYYKTSLVVELFDKYKVIKPDDIKQILYIEQGISDPEFRDDISAQKLLFYLKTENKQEIQGQLRQFRSQKDGKKFINTWFLRTSINLLEEKGFRSDSEKLWISYWNYNLKRKDISSLIKSLSFSPHDKIKRKIFENKIVELIGVYPNYEAKAIKILEFCKYLFNSAMFMEAEKQLEKFVYRIMKTSDWKKNSNLLRIILDGSKNRFVLRVLSYLENFNTCLIQKFNFREEEKYRDLNKKIISYLMRAGQYKKLGNLFRDIKKRSKNNTRSTLEIYHEYFKFCIIRELLHFEENPKNIFKLINEINNISLKKDLLFNHINFLDRDNEESVFLKLVDSQVSLEINDKWLKDEHLANLAMICLRKHHLEKAMEIIKQIKYVNTKSILFYELAQYYVREYGIKNIKAILDQFNLTKDCQAYIYSILAARLWNDGEEQEATTYFKNAIDRIIESETGDLSIILDDYFYAFKYTKLTRHKAWGKLNIVE